MIQALQGLKTTSKAVGSSVEDAIEGFTADQKTWDQCMDTYNKSLCAYSACAAILETFEAELVQLKKSCSVQPVPATCPDMIAALQKKVVAQNASCVTSWAGVAVKREKLLRAEAEVRSICRSRPPRASTTVLDMPWPYP